MRGMELIIDGEMEANNKEIMEIHNIDDEKEFEEIKDKICTEICVKAKCEAETDPQVNDVICNLSGHLKNKFEEWVKK